MKKVKTIALFTLLFFIARTVDAQYADVFKNPFPLQYRVLDSLAHMLAETDSSGTGKILKELETAAGKTQDQKAILNFRRFKLNYDFLASSAKRNKQELNELMTDARMLLETIDEKKYPEIAAMVHVNIANIYYFNINQYNLAFAHYLKAYDLFKKLPVEAFPDRHYTQYMVALAYYQFNDFGNAIILGKEIDSLYPVKDYISVFTVQMIGASYFNLKRYDSALVYYTWVLNNVHLSFNPTAWKGIAMGSIGNIYFQTNRFDKARPYLDSGVFYTLQTDVPDNTADFAANLSTIYLKQGKPAEAKRYTDIAHTALLRSYTPFHNIKGFRWLSNCQTVYLALSAYYKAINNSTLAWMYMDSAIFYKDSLMRLHDVNLKYQGEILAEKEKTAQHETLLQQQISTQKLIRNSVLIFIGLAMLITLLLYNRSKLKSRHREEQLLTEKQLAEAELKNARERLNEFTKSIIEKNELIEEIRAEVIKLQVKQLPEAAILPSINDNSLKSLQASVLLTDNDWKNFTRLFDTVHEGFFIRLKEKLPGLSPAETRFLALSKLKLNNKEMAAMLGVSTDAIRQTRSRLKRKLNMPDENGLEEALEKI